MLIIRDPYYILILQRNSKKKKKQERDEFRFEGGTNALGNKRLLSIRLPEKTIVGILKMEQTCILLRSLK